MKKIQSLGKSLTKEHQRNIVGGEGEAGQCVWCSGFGGPCGNGVSSCWYRSGGGNANTICQTIYSGCEEAYGTWGSCVSSCIFN